MIEVAQKSFLKMRYLSEEESKEYIVTIDDGLVFLNGKRFSSNGLRNDHAHFVIDPKGTIYTSREDSPIEFNHSSYVAGKEVMCAGSWRVQDGDIHLICDSSNHYVALDKKNLDWCINLLKEKGVEFEGISIFYSSEDF